MKFHLTARMWRRSRRQWYAEIIDAMYACLQELGHEVSEGDHLRDDAINVVFCWQMWERMPALELSRYRLVAFQSEQLPPGGYLEKAPPWYLESLRQAEAVWDYSSSNVSVLAAHGIAASWVPFYYHPSLQFVPTGNIKQDIPILFYGWRSDRRDNMIERLRPLSIEYFPAGLWGDYRNAVIQRSKIVLNVHWYESALTPHLRFAPLLANRVAIVSERCVDNPYGDAIAEADYDELPDLLRYYLEDEHERLALAVRGHSRFKNMKFHHALQEAIKKLP